MSTMMLYLYILRLGDEMEVAVAEDSKEKNKKGMELEKRKQMQIDSKTTVETGREINRRKSQD